MISSQLESETRSDFLELNIVFHDQVLGNGRYLEMFHLDGGIVCGGENQYSLHLNDVGFLQVVHMEEV